MLDFNSLDVQTVIFWAMGGVFGALAVASITAVAYIVLNASKHHDVGSDEAAG